MVIHMKKRDLLLFLPQDEEDCVEELHHFWYEVPPGPVGQFPSVQALIGQASLAGVRDQVVNGS